MKSPPKWDTRVVVTLVDKSALANLLSTRLTLNGGGMQYNTWNKHRSEFSILPLTILILIIHTIFLFILYLLPFLSTAKDWRLHKSKGNFLLWLLLASVYTWRPSQKPKDSHRSMMNTTILDCKSVQLRSMLKAQQNTKLSHFHLSHLLRQKARNKLFLQLIAIIIEWNIVG